MTRAITVSHFQATMTQGSDSSVRNKARQS